MAQFLYQARDGSGEPATGTIQAESAMQASIKLRSEGLFIVNISEAKEADRGVQTDAFQQRGRKIKRTEVINFAHQLAVMIDTGVPISDALHCIAEQTTNQSFRHVLDDVVAQVHAGNEFSSALRKYPKVFPSVMISLIQASEVTGTMGQILDRVSQYLQKEQQTRRKVKGAVSYPLFMFFMAMGMSVFLLTFVLPKFTAIFAGRGATLPAPTRLLITISDLLTNFWWLWIALLLVSVVTVLVMRRMPVGRRAIDSLKLNMPIIGPLFRKLYITRSCRTMGTMVSAGISMIDMVMIVRQVTNNAFYEDLWDEVGDSLRQGAQLSDPLFASSLFPRSISQMIYSGERSGRLGQVMTRVGEYTEGEFDDAVKTTTQFIEPAMVTFMGLFIGFVAISLLLPIFSVSQVIAGN